MIKHVAMDPAVDRIWAPWTDTIAWDPTLDRWEQFIRYYPVIRRSMKRYQLFWTKCKDNHHVRLAAIDVAERGLLHSIETFDPERSANFEAYATWDVGMDLWTFWHEKFPRMQGSEIVTGLHPENERSIAPTYYADNEFWCTLQSDRNLTEPQKFIVFWTFNDQVTAVVIQKRLADMGIKRSTTWVSQQLKAALKILAKSYS